MPRKKPTPEMAAQDRKDQRQEQRDASRAEEREEKELRTSQLRAIEWRNRHSPGVNVAVERVFVANEIVTFLSEQNPRRRHFAQPDHWGEFELAGLEYAKALLDKIEDEILEVYAGMQEEAYGPEDEQSAA